MCDVVCKLYFTRVSEKQNNKTHRACTPEIQWLAPSFRIVVANILFAERLALRSVGHLMKFSACFHFIEEIPNSERREFSVAHTAQSPRAGISTQALTAWFSFNHCAMLPVCSKNLDKYVEWKISAAAATAAAAKSLQSCPTLCDAIDSCYGTSKITKGPVRKLKSSTEPSTDHKPPTDQDRTAEGRGFAAWGRSHRFAFRQACTSSLAVVPETGSSREVCSTFPAESWASWYPCGSCCEDSLASESSPESSSG